MKKSAPNDDLRKSEITQDFDIVCQSLFSDKFVFASRKKRTAPRSQDGLVGHNPAWQSIFL